MSGATAPSAGMATAGGAAGASTVIAGSPSNTSGAAGATAGGASAGVPTSVGGGPAAGVSGSPAGASGGPSSAGAGGSAAGAPAGGGGSTGTGTLSWSPNEAVYSYPRTAAGPTQMLTLRNMGAAAANVNVTLSGTHAVAFRITAPTALPAMVAPGASLAVSVQFMPNLLPDSGATAAPAPDNGGVAVQAALSASGTGGAAVNANLYGLAMTKAGAVAGGEATLGQSLQTLGYDVDIGNGLETKLANTTATTLQGSEVRMPRFVKAGTGPVVLRPVARFSPSGPMPYGYYTAAAPSCPTGCTTVGTMSENSDANTSNGSRMLNPPFTSPMMNEFDPGTMPFGIWAFTDQVAAGSPANGNYLYSDDAPNMPANMHRVRVWPLRDRAGMPIANSYLIGCEEAANGDYQDYVLIISNVRAP